MAFDAQRLNEYFLLCKEHKEDIDIATFVAGCEEIKSIVHTLGYAFGIAAKDIDEKCGILRKRLVELDAELKSQAPTEGGDSDAAPAADAAATPVPRRSIQAMVLSEVRRGCANSNTSKYVSGARSTLRLMWFCDFIHALLSNLLAADSVELGDAAKRAYVSALEPHHTWIVKQTIHAALHFLPTRTAFFASLADGMSTPEELKQRLGAFLDLVSPVRDSLWEFYRVHKLDKLP